jgi:hypothetical protein
MEVPSQTMLLTRVKTDIKELFSARLRVPIGIRSDQRADLHQDELDSVSAANAQQSIATARLPTTVSTIQQTILQKSATQTTAQITREEATPIRSILITAPVPPAELNAIQSDSQADAIISSPAPSLEVPTVDITKAERPSVEEIDNQAPAALSESIATSEEKAIQQEIALSPPKQASETNLPEEQYNTISVISPTAHSATLTQQDDEAQELRATINTPSFPTSGFLSHLEAQIQDCQKPLYGLNVSIKSFTIQRKKKGLYIGLLPAWPVPKQAEDQWESATQSGMSLQERLMLDLLKAAQKRLGQIESDLEHIELELRMIGRVTGKATTVDLKPTILARCRTRKCRKVLRQAIGDLTYIPTALNKESAAIKLHAARQANLQLRQTPQSSLLAQSSRASGLRGGALVGVVVGSLVFALTIWGTILWIWRKRWKRYYDPPPHVSELGYKYKEPAADPRRNRRASLTSPFRNEGSTLGRANFAGSAAAGSNIDLIGVSSYGPGGTYHPLQDLRPVAELPYASPPAHKMSGKPHTLSEMSHRTTDTARNQYTHRSAPEMPDTRYAPIYTLSTTTPGMQTSLSNSLNIEPARSSTLQVPETRYTHSAMTPVAQSSQFSSPTLESTRSPVTSASRYLGGPTYLTPKTIDYDTLIETRDNPSICGLKCRWVFERPGSKNELISTIGGMLRVNDRLWGFTTAHAIFAANRRGALQDLASHKNALMLQTSSKHGTPEQSDSESSTESEQWEEESEKPAGVPVSRLIVNTVASSQPALHDTRWTKVFPHGLRSFAGWDFSDDNETTLTPSIICDFALIHLDAPHASLLNSYRISADGQPPVTVCVEEIIQDNDLIPGPVLILTHPGVSEQAYLLPGKSLFSMLSKSFNTRKLRLETPLSKSSSHSFSAL